MPVVGTQGRCVISRASSIWPAACFSTRAASHQPEARERARRPAPHVYTFVDLKDDQGKTTNWKVEMGSPTELTKAGWTRKMIERMFLFAPGAVYVAEWLHSFREFPPRQKPGSFNLDRVMESIVGAQRGSGR